MQNTVDDLNGRVRALFRECSAKKGKIDNADEIFEDIRKTYRKALDDADDKVRLSIILASWSETISHTITN